MNIHESQVGQVVGTLLTHIPMMQQQVPSMPPPPLQQAPQQRQPEQDSLQLGQQDSLQQPILTDIDRKPSIKVECQVEKSKPREDLKKKKEAIDSQAREIIYKVIRFFESEKQNRGYAFPVENVVKRACAATGLSESTIKRIKRDGLRAEATHTRMQGPKKKRVRKTKVQLDYYQLCALRGIVNGYQNRKEIPTLGKILASAKHELQYKGGKESLRLILLNKLGIKFKKCEKKIKKPPEEETMNQPTQPQVNNVNLMHNTPHQQHNMQHMELKPQHMEMKSMQMKPMENQCVYTTIMHQVPVNTVSY